jgi:RNA recognition motif-containing protein
LSRAGIIRNITLPKYKNKQINKEYCFVEFSCEEEAKKAVGMFNQTTPREFVNVNSPEYIATECEIWPWKVMLKD